MSRVTKSRVTTRLWWLPPALALPFAAPAAAAPMEPDAGAQASSFLDVFGVSTTNGVSLSQWQLSIDPGGTMGIGNPFVQLIQLGWMVWRVGCGAALWLIDVAQNLLWLKLLRGPMNTILDPMIVLLHETKLAWLLGVVGVAIALLSWKYGKTGAAVMEILGVLVMFSLATGVLANPASGLTKPGGVIEKVQGAGEEATAALGDGQGDSGTSKTSQRLADLAIAQPAQLFNFGRLVPTKCQDVYTAALNQGPYEEDDAAVRDAVSGCDENVTPQNVTMIFGTWTALAPTLYTVMAFGGLLGGAIIGLGLLIVWWSVQLVWDAIKGIAPGAGRASLIITLTYIGVGLVVFVLAMIALAVGTQGLLELYTTATGPEFGMDPFTVYFITDALLLLLAIGFVVKLVGAIRKARRQGEKIAKSLSPKPRAMPQPVTQRLANSPIGGFAKGAGASAVGNLVGNGGLGQKSKNSPRHPAGARGDTGGPANGPSSGTAQGQQRGSMLKSTLGAASKAGALAFHSTLGLPVAAPKAVAAAKTAAHARSTAMHTKLDAAKARVHTRADAVNDYGNEWTHNVGVAARWTSRALGATQAASLIAPQLAPVAAAASIAVSARDGRGMNPQPALTRQHGAPTPAARPQPAPTPPRPAADGAAAASSPSRDLSAKLARAKTTAARPSPKASPMPYQMGGPT